MKLKKFSVEGEGTQVLSLKPGGGVERGKLGRGKWMH